MLLDSFWTGFRRGRWRLTTASVMSVDFKRLQNTLNQPARSEPFNDLLAEVAPFMEVQRVRLIRFLSKVALADIFTIAWRAVLQTHYSKRVFIRRYRARRLDFS